MDCQDCPLYGKMEEWTLEGVPLQPGRGPIDGLYDEIARLQSQVQYQEEQRERLGGWLHEQLQEILAVVLAVEGSLEILHQARKKGRATPPGELPALPGLVPGEAAPEPVPSSHPLMVLLRQERYGLVNQVIDTLLATDPDSDLEGAGALEVEGFLPPTPRAPGKAGKPAHSREDPRSPEAPGCLF